MRRTWLRLGSSILAIAVAIMVVGWYPPLTMAEVTGGIVYAPKYVAADITPYALYFQINGLTPDTWYALKIRNKQVGGTDYRGRTWSDYTSTWLSQTAAYENHPAFQADGSGAIKGWLYGRTDDSTLNGSTNREFQLAYQSCSAQHSGCSGTNTAPDTFAIAQVLDMASGGGWVEESTGTARAGRAVAVKSGTNIYGLYVAEDNSVNEGYSGTGYYKIAVPTCTNCGYSIETWDFNSPGVAIGQVNTMPDANGNNTVSAGATTSLTFSKPTAITLSSLTAASPLPAALPFLGLVALGGLAAVAALGIGAGLVRRRR